MGLRNRSIRMRVFLLILIPIIALAALYAFAARVTGSAALSMARAKTVKAVIAVPTANLQAQLDAERHLAMLYLASPAPQLLTALGLQERSTGRALRAFGQTAMSHAVTRSASPRELRAIRTLQAEAGGLGSLRASVTARAISRPAALAAYSGPVWAGYQVLDQAILQETNVPLVTQALAIIRLDQAGQTLYQESDLLVSDLAARSFPAADRQEFTELAAVRGSLLTQTLPELTPAYQAYFGKYVSPQAAAALTALENKAIRLPARAILPPIRPLAWYSAVARFSGGFGQAISSAGGDLAAKARAQARSTYLQLLVASGLGLLAIIVSVLLSVLIGRGLVRQLAELRQSALDLAHRRLPDTVARLRGGQDVDIPAEAPPKPRSGEIGQVRQAFDAVRRTAIEAAVDEARLRRGLSDVFRNLARRSQSLLHRQLALLDGMERRASEPEQLEDLFRIDHLATRMRRHAEGLVVLAGDSPGRGWRHPVPLVDVLRAAVAEVEDYTRIRVICRTDAALAGAAVADVIHLIAELAENAAIFSPPNTSVRILGDTVGNGFAVEVEDRGLGISAEQLADINRDLAEPPQFDLSGSDRLGLFVAGRLAQRHGVKISLRASVFGGTTAIVLIPRSLLADPGPAGSARPAGPRAELPLRLARRRSALSPGRALDPGPPGFAPAGAAELTERPGAAVAIGELPDPGPASEQDDTLAAGAEPRVSTADLTQLGLPVRIRRETLAPQLRESSALSAGQAATPAAQRSPELARATMTALQRGWERGRSSSIATPEAAIAAGPASAGPASAGPASAGPASAGPASRGRAARGRVPEGGDGR